MRNTKSEQLGRALVAELVEPSVAERAARRLEILSQDLEFGEIAPTAEAGRTCRDYLAAAASGMRLVPSFPFPHISTGGEGDLSCEWRGSERSLIALISPSGEMAIHRATIKDGRTLSSEVVPGATIEDLRAAVEWFTAESTPA
jgi:hypothetical protein